MSILSNWLSKEADKISSGRINSFKEKAFAENDSSKIYGRAFELNGFKFLKLTILGPLQVKTHDGCKVKFEVDNHELPAIDSDSTEIKTDFSGSLGIGLTEFDLDVDDALIAQLNEKEVNSISISFPNNFIKFLIQDPTLLRAALVIPVVPEPEEPQPAEGEANEENQEIGNSAPL